MNLSRIISDIMWFWRRKHPPMRSIPAWREAARAEANAARRGCTRDVGRARKAKRDALHASMLPASRPAPMGRM